MSEEQVLDIVEQYVDRHQPRDYRFVVSRRGVRHEGNWWYVVVTPTKPDIRAYDYSHIMSQVEEEIESQYAFHVLLIPADAD